MSFEFAFAKIEYPSPSLYILLSTLHWTYKWVITPTDRPYQKKKTLADKLDFNAKESIFNDKDKIINILTEVEA